MAKEKSTYVCQSCGATFMRWMGRCTDCGEWNTVVEERTTADEGKHTRPRFGQVPEARPITAGGVSTPPRLSTGMNECDRVMGGGIVPGSLTLIGGDPGIGKSTLMLQICHHVARSGAPVLYVSGEESFDQTRLRGKRLGTLNDNLMLLTETQIESIENHLAGSDYGLVVVDSIQSVYSSQLPSVPGSVGQVRECANALLRLAKGTDIPVFLVGHVTKDGSIAGPRVLEHLVDTVLYFEGEDKHALRILRSVKNRFGSTNEVGVFEMSDAGLHEVLNPSALFLNERPKGVSGSIVIPSIEGTRPLLVEVQALVGEPSLASPRRTVTGVNPNRVSLLLAVLEKRAGIRVSDRDVFVNVAGGVKLDEPAADVAVALALTSSLLEVPALANVIAFGEVGLAGEVRAVNMPRPRVAEGVKFGFTKCILPKGSAGDVDSQGVEILPVINLSQAIDLALER